MNIVYIPPIQISSKFAISTGTTEDQTITIYPNDLNFDQEISSGQPPTPHNEEEVTQSGIIEFTDDLSNIVNEQTIQFEEEISQSGIISNDANEQCSTQDMEEEIYGDPLSEGQSRQLEEELMPSQITGLDNHLPQFDNHLPQLDNPMPQIIKFADHLSNGEPTQLVEKSAQSRITENQLPQFEEKSAPSRITENHITQLDEEEMKQSQMKEMQEKHENLQTFLIEDSTNKNNYPGSEIVSLSVESKQHMKSICSICHKSFPNHNKLNWHMRMHDKNRKRFECPQESCGRLYASKQSCDLHYKQTHLDEGHFCPICHKIFGVKQTLEVHMRYHAKDFPYQCNCCDRKFAQKGHLTQHIEVKHQHLRYICTESDCGKTFKNSVSLKNHRYTHSAMPFKCNICNREYPQKNKLRVHLLQKHNMDLTLDDLEQMRQFQSVRTRHAYVKVQTMEVVDSVNGDLVNSSPFRSDFLEILDARTE